MELPNWLRAPPKPTRVDQMTSLPKPIARDDLVSRIRVTGHPDPEKMADTMLRARDHASKLRLARPKTMLMTEVPKFSETAPKCPKPGGDKCKAKTLEGRQCGFRASCNGFCKKHAVTTKI